MALNLDVDELDDKADNQGDTVNRATAPCIATNALPLPLTLVASNGNPSQSSTLYVTPSINSTNDVLFHNHYSHRITRNVTRIQNPEQVSRRNGILFQCKDYHTVTHKYAAQVDQLTHHNISKHTYLKLPH